MGFDMADNNLLSFAMLEIFTMDERIKIVNSKILINIKTPPIKFMEHNCKFMSYILKTYIPICKLYTILLNLK